MRKTVLLAALGLSLPAVASAQALFVDNFDYPDSTVIGGTGATPTTANALTNWASHSGTSGQIKAGATFNQTFTSTPAYPSQSGGGLRLYASRGEDINHLFTQQDPGAATKSVYASVVVTPTAVPNDAAGSYFFHVTATTVAGATFRGRVWMAAGAVAGTVKFGVSVAGTPAFAATEYALGTKLLLVLRYDIVPGALNDGARLYVFPEGAAIATEPATPSATAPAPANNEPDPANIGAVAIRQGTTGSGNTGDLSIDGVRVGLSWNDAPLPVELTAFNAVSNGTTARLAWTTASETNNAGFGVEHLQGATWVERGFAAGHGTTTERNDYAFDVAGLTAGRHTFRLRQTDLDGTAHYSPLASVEIGVSGGLTLTALGARALRIESERAADVSVYDMLGRQVMSQRVESGTSEMRFDGLSAGVYVVRAIAGGTASTLSVVVR